MGLRHKHYDAGLGSILFYDLCRTLIVLIGVTLFRFRAYHAERVPPRGPLLLIANHQSYLDPPLLGVCVPHRHTDFLARFGLFTSRALGWLIRTLHAMPIRQDQPDTVAMKEALRRLELGAAVLVFPEGSRSLTGNLQKFKRGVALLVKRSSCPVLPCAIDGAHEAWPRGGRPRLLGTRIAVLYGKPIPHDELMAHGADAAVARLEREVASLLAELRERQAARQAGRKPRLRTAVASPVTSRAGASSASTA